MLSTCQIDDLLISYRSHMQNSRLRVRSFRGYDENRDWMRLNRKQAPPFSQCLVKKLTARVALYPKYTRRGIFKSCHSHGTPYHHAFLECINSIIYAHLRSYRIEMELLQAKLRSLQVAECLGTWCQPHDELERIWQASAAYVASALYYPNIGTASPDGCSCSPFR